MAAGPVSWRPPLRRASRVPAPRLCTSDPREPGWHPAEAEPPQCCLLRAHRCRASSEAPLKDIWLDHARPQTQSKNRSGAPLGWQCWRPKQPHGAPGAHLGVLQEHRLLAAWNWARAGCDLPAGSPGEPRQGHADHAPRGHPATGRSWGQGWSSGWHPIPAIIPQGHSDNCHC